MTVWQVLGGNNGGIMVRKEQNLNSDKLGKRLSAGALVSEIQLENGRLHYDLVRGDGPQSGWVSVTVSGKELVAKVDVDVKDSELLSGPLGEDSNMPPKELLNVYARHFGREGVGNDSTLGQHKKCFSWTGFGVQSAEKTEQVLAQLGKDLEVATGNRPKAAVVVLQKDLVVDAEGQTLRLCSRCRLPVGDVVYTSQDAPNVTSRVMHAECMAQNLLQKLQNDEVAALCKAKAMKQKHRAEYDIGWKVTQVPRNVEVGKKLQNYSSVPAGMSCLVWNAARNKVNLAATLEPAAALNLEYLSLALQVYKRTGREPWFSLELVNAEKVDSFQKKVFDPDWLAGTSLGEVMFQADYHLKELSMGEYDQPVVGMQSCFDMPGQGKKDFVWNAREWFVVNKCEVQLADDDVLIPCVKMGVQAREQVLNETRNRMEDIPVTRRSHPCVMYAEQFTRNFELIAERKSVINQLREVAKATAIAKFLIDSKTDLESEWFGLNEEVKPDSCVMEVPQMWNMRGASQIQVKDGKIVGDDRGFTSEFHSIYGGVEFGIDKFRLSAPTMGVPAPAARAAVPATGLQTFSTSVGRPQGVDLNMRKFNLSAPVRVNGQMHACSASLDSAEAKVPIGSTFVEQLKNNFAESAFEEHHKTLLKKVYNPNLCDRHSEGNMFLPPETRLEYVRKLEQLVKEESDAMSQRVHRFTQKDFKMESPGKEFPPTWRSAYQLSRGDGETLSRADRGSLQPGGQLQSRPDYKAQAWVFEHLLKTTIPVFDKMTEDGSRFRIYRNGSIEVRTVKEYGSEEKVVGVLSVQLSSLDMGAEKEAVNDAEKFVKVTHFVEKIATDLPCQDDKILPQHRFYVVAETDAGNVIVTEKLDFSTVTFQENPQDLQDRNSLAKTVQSYDCSHSNSTVLSLKTILNQGVELSLTGKGYTEGVIAMLNGQVSY